TTRNSNYNIIDLGDEWVGPVLSPEYWRQIEGNLMYATLIHSDTRLNAWADWFREADVARPTPSKQRSFGHFYFSIQAAIDSLGTVVGSYPLIMDEVKRGNLIAPYGFIKIRISICTLDEKIIVWRRERLNL
ncbi:transcriptional regulator, partial [Salmonella enterica subsp. enterica serovar Senftenberg str. 361154004]